MSSCGGVIDAIFVTTSLRVYVRAAVDAASKTVRYVTVDIGAVAGVQERAHVFKDQAICIQIHDVIAGRARYAASG